MTIAETCAQAWQYHQAGNLAQAEQLYRQVLQCDSTLADAWGYLGSVCQAQGKLSDAETSFRRVVQLSPNNINARNCLAVVLVQQNKLDEAAASLQDALRLQPENADLHTNLGSVLARLGQVHHAIASYRQALRLGHDHAQVHYNLGLALTELGEDCWDEAAACFQQAIRLDPGLAEPYYQLGTLLQRRGLVGQAIDSYQKAINLNLSTVGVYYHLGTALQSQDRLDEAADCYRRALEINADVAEAHNNLGSILEKQGHLNDAMLAYRRALQLNSDYADAQNNLGTALQAKGKWDEAAACHRRALQLKPDFADAYTHLGMALRELGQLDEIIACHRKALELGVATPAILGDLTHYLQQVCDWSAVTELSHQVIEAVASNSAEASTAPLAPFQFLALPIATTARQQYECARQWARQITSCQRSDIANSDIGRRSSDGERSRLKIGYLSFDFRIHAIGYLIPELIEKHDRDRFTILGYSYGPDDGSAIRRRLISAFDEFIDLREATFTEAAQRIREDNVDILVDLTAYTGRARTEILALRPAPIQVNYLGYPGTMGAPFVDYIIVDDFVVPADQQEFFSEKLVHLPGCYQVNDSQREIADRTPTRAECGLPEEGFVLCCFNKTYKITPAMFDLWMRLLKRLDGSVLWLLAVNRFAPANLRREAERRGVSGERLVFAPRQPLAQHLARHRLADLFLDTLPYNAHTTTSDSLWAGCPVLTVTGQTFPSRVATSLLRTIDLPALITNSLEEYEEMALRLAREPHLLKELRSRLQDNRGTSGLFDGGQFARNLEKAFWKMWEFYQSGEKPRGFAVEEARARIDADQRGSK